MRIAILYTYIFKYSSFLNTCMMRTMQSEVEVLASDINKLNATFSKIAKGQDFVAGVCFKKQESNTFKIHHETYAKLRKKFGLPAQLAIVANKYACAACKGKVKPDRDGNVGTKPTFNGNAIHFDDRSANINFEKGTASILTVKGRIKVKFNICRYFRRYLGWKAKESNLIKCRDGKLRLMISVEAPTKVSRKTGNILGIDRGINNLIATSDGWLFDSQHVWAVKRRYVRLRRSLQSKGTRSAKRHLSKMRSREKRFMRDVNHCVSRKIIDSIGTDGVAVLENLDGIRKARHRHEQNWLFSNWAFYQFEKFLAYKGQEKGVAIEYVPARDTSKTCSLCGSLKAGQRKGSVFTCKTCGVVMHADLNAADNIIHRYTDKSNSLRAAINQPIAPDRVEQAHTL